MATYQAFFVAGDLVQDVGYAHGLHYRNAVSARLSPREQRRTRHALLRTPALAGWLQGQLGAYPFETTGGVRTALPIGFALENQTRPVYPTAPGTALLVHELAHQWLGNSVGLDRWKDIWLNEGIATWLEWRYIEARAAGGTRRPGSSASGAPCPPRPGSCGSATPARGTCSTGPSTSAAR